MLASKDRVLVEDVVCTCCAVRTKRVHHREFPEIHVECGSVAEGAAHLAKKLSQYRDGALSEWRREAIDLAIADVASFLDSLVEVKDETGTTCLCGPRVPNRSGSPLSQLGPSR